MICGTDPYPTNFRAKKYKIKDKFFSKEDFQFMMRNLPVPVEEEEIDEMFEFADKDKDGKISYRCVLLDKFDSYREFQQQTTNRM